MNKRMVVWILVMLLVLVSVTTNFITTLFALLVMGIVPGTSWTIPAWLMLVAYPLLFFTVLRWLTRQPMFIGSQAHNEKVARSLARKRVTKTAKKTVRKSPKLETTRRRYRSAV